MQNLKRERFSLEVIKQYAKLNWLGYRNQPYPTSRYIETKSKSGVLLEDKRIVLNDLKTT